MPVAGGWGPTNMRWEIQAPQSKRNTHTHHRQEDEGEWNAGGTDLAAALACLLILLRLQ